MQESRPNFLLFWLAVNAVGVLASAAYFIYLVVIYATEGAAPPKDSSAGTKVDSWSPDMKIGKLDIQRRAKKIKLSSVTHVPSGLMGCALAALGWWVGGWQEIKTCRNPFAPHRIIK